MGTKKHHRTTKHEAQRPAAQTKLLSGQIYGIWASDDAPPPGNLDAAQNNLASVLYVGRTRSSLTQRWNELRSDGRSNKKPWMKEYDIPPESFVLRTIETYKEEYRNMEQVIQDIWICKAIKAGALLWNSYWAVQKQRDFFQYLTKGRYLSYVERQ